MSYSTDVHPATGNQFARSHAGSGVAQIAESRRVCMGPSANSNAATLTDEDILRLVLSRAADASEVGSLTNALMAEFGSLNRIVSAPPRRLGEVQGVGASVIRELKVVEAAARRLTYQKSTCNPVLDCFDTLQDYCSTAAAHPGVTKTRVLFLDRNNALIADETQSKHVLDAALFNPREMLKRALELGASALVLVRVCPCADPKPTAADIAIAHRLADASDALGIALRDHLLLNGTEMFSLRKCGFF